jgi:hypothetical protein
VHWSSGAAVRNMELIGNAGPDVFAFGSYVVEL